ncbi:MAG: methyltransferase domain-containing protein [Candidatus Dojkabacteria bacterium]|jgi:ubiquinone/menaquinone biosynthesis C-methylase UbiE
MNRVANYDTLDYNYQTYWLKREYENMAEHILLARIMKNKGGKWFIDIGGSYGRLADIYYKKYKKPIIVDYSLKTLKKNYQYLIQKYPDITLIAANAYNLPFKQNTFDGALMVRVLHHIEKPNQYFKEIYRTIKPNGKYIQEFANKLHIKAVIRAILKLNFSIFTKDPYQQPTQGNFEGARKDSNVAFYNYHYLWVKDLLKKTGFRVVKRYGCSFLRIGFLKKMFSTKVLLLIENLLQKTLSWTNIAPSIFLDSTVIKEDGDMKEYNKLEEILVCPACKSNLEFNSNTAYCKKCSKRFKKEGNIWDFRV